LAGKTDFIAIGNAAFAANLSIASGASAVLTDNSWKIDGCRTRMQPPKP
jgi:hypothetical protein